jgi:glycosyltransferase involved in cell wall biosynthesis
MDSITGDGVFDPENGMKSPNPGAIRVLNCLHRSSPGGGQQRVLEVGEALLQKGVETCVVFPDDGEVRYEGMLRERSLPYVRMRLLQLRAAKRVVNNVGFLLDLPFQVSRLAKLIRKREIDLVHVNGVTNIGPVLAALVTRRPIIWHWNDTLTPQWFVNCAKWLVKAPRVRLVAASRAIPERYRLGCVRQRFVGVLPPPVLFSDSSVDNGSEEDPIADCPHGVQVLGYVSNLLAAKGALEFVEVVGKLRAEGLPLIGVMVGGVFSGHEQFAETVRRRAEVEGSAVRLLGHRRDIAGLMARFDALLFPSHTEAAPIVVLQALARGVPIVATAVGNVAEVLDGLDMPVVPVGDIEAMAAGVWKVLRMSSVDRAAYAAKARRRIEDGYSLAAVVERHVAIYRAALDAAD